jgi:hypothetical protein
MLIKAANALLANLRYYTEQEGKIGEIQLRIAEKNAAKRKERVA